MKWTISGVGEGYERSICGYNRLRNSRSSENPVWGEEGRAGSFQPLLCHVCPQRAHHAPKVQVTGSLEETVKKDHTEWVLCACSTGEASLDPLYSQKDKLEEADFSSLEWKLHGVDVKQDLFTLLHVILDPVVHMPTNLLEGEAEAEKQEAAKAAQDNSSVLDNSTESNSWKLLLKFDH